MCHFYALGFVCIKQKRYNMLIRKIERCLLVDFVTFGVILAKLS